MSVTTKLVKIQEMIKRFKRLKSFSCAILIIDAVVLIFITEFTSWRTPDFYKLLFVMTIVAIASGFVLMAFSGIQAGLEKARNIFKELK